MKLSLIIAVVTQDVPLGIVDDVGYDSLKSPVGSFLLTLRATARVFSKTFLLQTVDMIRSCSR